MTKGCCFPKCKRENALVWLGKPLCDDHWNWVCDHDKEMVYAKLGVKGSIVDDEKPRGQTKDLAMLDVASFTKGPIIVESEPSQEKNPIVKKTKQAYTEEIDKQLLELKSKNLSIGEIAKMVGRSYASTMYRLRVLKA